jgi:hypothetical protein
MNKYTYLENRIIELMSQIGGSFADLQNRYEMDSYAGYDEVPEDEEEIRDMIKSSFAEDVKSVYRLICNYFENQQHFQYLAEFKLAMGPYLAEPKKLLSGEMNDYDGHVHSKLILEISDFLNAYEFYGEQGYEYLMRRAGILYLENILENTAVIINDLKKKPNSEADVYKSVKVVCRAAFPTAQYPTTPFISIAKEYKPDILIPYLNCAIEYKYATDENRLKEIIDQILIDVHGYSNHPTYKIFYAVFYVKPDIWGRKKFEEVWKEKNFPQNWKGIYVVG